MTAEHLRGACRVCQTRLIFSTAVPSRNHRTWSPIAGLSMHPAFDSRVPHLERCLVEMYEPQSPCVIPADLGRFCLVETARLHLAVGLLR